VSIALNEYSAPIGLGVLADGMLMVHNELRTRMIEGGIHHRPSKVGPAVAKIIVVGLRAAVMTRRGDCVRSGCVPFVGVAEHSIVARARQPLGTMPALRRARSGHEAGRDVMKTTTERRLTGRYAPQLLVVITVSGLVFNAARPGLVQAQGSSTTGRVEFDIPEQSLAGALERYMSLSNVTIVVDSAVIGERRSSAVRGALSQDGALQSLLEGTGLDSRRIGPAAYTLVPLPQGAEARPRLPRFMDYAAAVQRAVTLALCRMDDTSPVRYRTVVRLWLHPDGKVRQAELAVSTGSASRDGAITGVLGGVTVGAAVPRDLPQPIKLAIASRRSDDAACSSDPGLARPSPQLGVGMR
jgi:hypothetical protein